MHSRPILSAALALLLFSAVSAPALERSDVGGDEFLSLPKIAWPGLFGRSDEAPVQRMAQAGDPRITALEEQIRSLSGTLEELNFQILQMQEQMRKMQEDNEFRFQELEQKKTDAGGGTGKRVAKSAPADDQEQAGGEAPPSIEEIIVEEPVRAAGTDGSPETTFGTITFDEKGNVIGGSVSGSAAAAPAGAEASAETGIPEGSPSVQTDQTVVAALPTTDDPDELYRNSYEFILSGDYGTAETGFRSHIERFPGDQKTADARFWLGESQLGQKKYREAAETFLSANKEYPSAKKAPDMLLKLGVALTGLDQRDVACATFAEIGKRYPDIGAPLRERVKQEQALAAC